MARPFAPPRRGGSGALAGILLALGIGGFLVLLLFVAAVLSAGSDDGGTAGGGITPMPTATGTDQPERPVNAGVGVPDLTPLGPRTSKNIDENVKGGGCDSFSNERNRTTYFANRGAGSAKKLRGRVLVLHLRVIGRQLTWTRTTATEVDEAAIVSQLFIRGQAKKRGLSDVSYDVATWTLNTSFALPALEVQSDDTFTDASYDELVREVRAALEATFGKSMESTVAELKGRGYDEVGFLVYLPWKTRARAFAEPAHRGGRNSAEMAFLFSKNALSRLSATATHEGLHLFGADDLYRIRGIDTTEQKDIMNAYCYGLGTASIGDSTAYAIGWTDAPPVRPYTFRVQ
jgi:hypothetical protein